MAADGVAWDRWRCLGSAVQRLSCERLSSHGNGHGENCVVVVVVAVGQDDGNDDGSGLDDGNRDRGWWIVGSGGGRRRRDGQHGRGSCVRCARTLMVLVFDWAAAAARQ